MSYNDSCPGSPDGQHDWQPVDGGGADCSHCSAATAMSPR